MKLIVKNFGAIKNMEIDLSKKVYLFVGYNNTGKTYLSNLLYGIFDQKTLVNFSESEYNKLSNDFDDEIDLNDQFVTDLLNDFGKYLAEVFMPKLLKVSKTHFIVSNLSIRFQYEKNELEEPNLNSGGSIAIQKKEEDGMNEITIFTLNKPKNSLKANLEYKSNEEIYQALPTNFFDSIPKNKFEKDISSVKKNVSKSLAHFILNLLIQNKERPFLLPANRIFLLENADELVSQDYTRKKEMAELFMEAVENKSLDSKNLRDLIAKKAESKHTTHIAKLIELISDLRKNKDEESVNQGMKFYDNFLEKMVKIMGGEVVMMRASPKSNWEEKFKINDIEEPIHFYLASSSVNQLALLFQYLKHWAKADKNFLMIDEPEINLHPENQILLINLLLEFACVNDNRLLLTTHSPLVAEIINNYLILDKVKSKGIEMNEEIQNVHYFNPRINVSNDQVGVYAFGKDGSITPYQFERYSMFFRTFNKEINKISEVQSILTDYIFYNQENEN